MALFESYKRAIKHSATVDLSAVGASGVATASVSLPAGAIADVGDIVMVNAPSLESGLVASAYMSAANTITLKVSNLEQGVKAQVTLTMDVKPIDGDTYTIDTKVYTFEDTLTNVDGNVAIGATLGDSQANLVSAITLTGTAGTDYALAMTAHPSVVVGAFAGDDAVITAKTAGVAGNSIATTETFTAGTNIFDAATLGTTTAGADGAPADASSQVYYFAVIR
jgi:hypothetical protein